MLENGRFRARVDATGLQCRQETTLHVRVTAAGHRPIEQEFTVAAGAPLPDLDLRLELGADAPPPESALRGRLPDGFGGPGLLSLWFATSEHEGANTAVCRGVPVSCGGHVGPWCEVAADGSFELRGPWQLGALCLQRPGLPPQWFLPGAEGELPRPIQTGSVEGRIIGMPMEAHGHCHAVLFGRGVIRRTARVARDGTFAIAALPAGVYHVRAGDDDFARVRDRLSAALGLGDHEGLARPSVGAVEVTVRAGGTTNGVDVPFDGA